MQRDDWIDVFEAWEARLGDLWRRPGRVFDLMARTDGLAVFDAWVELFGGRLYMDGMSGDFFSCLGDNRHEPKLRALQAMPKYVVQLFILVTYCTHLETPSRMYPPPHTHTHTHTPSPFPVVKKAV